MHTIVFSTGTNAFLRVEGALELGQVGVGIDSAEEDWFKLRVWFIICHRLNLGGI